MGDFNANPGEPATERMRSGGFRSAYADANGHEPAVTWPSGLQAPAIDTDGDPACLDYIWVRGAARVASARLVFDRPAADDLTLFPSDHFGIADAARDRLGGRSDAPAGAPWRLASRTREHAGRLPGGPRAARLRRARIRRAAVRRRRPGRLPRRHARARAGPSRAGRRAQRRGAVRARRPDPGGGARGRRPTAVPRRRAEGRDRARPDRGAGRRSRSGAAQRGRLVLRAGRARRRRTPGPGLAALAQRGGRSIAPPSPTRRRSAAAASPPSGTRSTRMPSRWRPRPGSRWRPGPSAAARPFDRLAAARRWWRSAWRRPRSTAEPGPMPGRPTRRDRRRDAWPASPPYPAGLSQSRRRDVADQADLVVIGAGTIGGWASVFARADGVGRVVVLERGLVGHGRLVAGRRDRPRPGRHAGDRRARSLVDRLLPRTSRQRTAPIRGFASSAT